MKKNQIFSYLHTAIDWKLRVLSCNSKILQTAKTAQIWSWWGRFGAQGLTATLRISCIVLLDMELNSNSHQLTKAPLIFSKPRMAKLNLIVSLFFPIQIKTCFVVWLMQTMPQFQICLVPLPLKTFSKSQQYHREVPCIFSIHRY